MERRCRSIISLMGSSLYSLFYGGHIQAATLTQPVNLDVSNDFPTISTAFQDSTDLLLSSTATSSIPLDDSDISLQVTLLAEKLDRLGDGQYVGNFAETFNSLKKVEWLSVIERLTSAPILIGDGGNGQNGNTDNTTNRYTNSYKVAEMENRTAPATGKRSIQDYLSFLNRQISPGGEVDLPAYRYNNERAGLSLMATPRAGIPDLISTERELHTGSAITEPTVRDGVKLDRPTVTVGKFQSALQLWPRNILATEVTGYGSESGNISETMKNFGTADVTVNYKTMPAEILRTSLDLEVNWVDRGEYSENLRQTNLAILDIYKSRNEQFQQRLEENRQKWVSGQQAYQQKVNSQMSQSFNSLQKQRSVPRSYSNLRGQSSTTPARYR